jgi:uncharacterized protein
VTFSCNATPDDLIDAIEANRIYVPCIYILNMIDKISLEELEVWDRIPHYVPIAGKLGWNFDELLETIWQYLGLFRVYTKPKGQIPDYERPVILRKKEACVEDFCNKIHRTLIQDFKHAQVWGHSVKFNPQKVGKGHVVMDEDIVQIVKN